MLVRPDGYVAYAADGNLASALPSVRTLLERQIVRNREAA
jgi:hypothetical protein